MNRRESMFMLGLASLAMLSGQDVKPTPLDHDPWVGTYFKYAEFDGQTGEAPTITITKEGDGYSLGKPYAGRLFREVSKGVLSDGKGGIGKIYLGSAVYSDGVRVPILRVEFCYEWFVLYSDHRARQEHAMPEDNIDR